MPKRRRRRRRPPGAAGRAAGERALGPDPFRAYAGHFWGAVETRPYMRARLGLARALTDAGDLEAAAEHYAELLRLNPGDNQGVRYLLLYLLLRLGRDGEADRLLRRHRDEPSAHWAWGRVLLAWRRRSWATASPCSPPAAGRPGPGSGGFAVTRTSVMMEGPSRRRGWGAA